MTIELPAEEIRRQTKLDKSVEVEDALRCQSYFCQSFYVQLRANFDELVNKIE